MKKAIIGKKVGMTQIFDETGKVIPVTVVEAGPCVVTQKKTVETDGYTAVQLGFEDIKESKLTKPEAGHLKKAGVEAKKHLKEFKLENAAEMNVGDVVKSEPLALGYTCLGQSLRACCLSGEVSKHYIDQPLRCRPELARDRYDIAYVGCRATLDIRLRRAAYGYHVYGYTVARCCGVAAYEGYTKALACLVVALHKPLGPLALCPLREREA